jgi:hypothetical protein
MLAALKEPDVGIRRGVAWSFAKINSFFAEPFAASTCSDEFEPLIAVLGDIDAKVRSNAAYALGAIESRCNKPFRESGTGETRPVEPLIAVLRPRSRRSGTRGVGSGSV